MKISRWQVKGADNLECREVCRNQGENGCTVWVEASGITKYGRYAIVDSVYVEDKILYLRRDYPCLDYGELWLAYRSKPKRSE